MKKIGNVILSAIITAVLVFGFASCGNNASGTGNTNPNGKPDNGGKTDENNEFVTSTDGRFSYKIENGIFYLNYNGSENPIIHIEYLQSDPNSGIEYWPWKGLRTDDNVICKKQMQFDVFEGLWSAIALEWGESGECTKETNFGICVKEVDGSKSGKDIFGGAIKVEIDIAKKVSELKDYSKKSFTPKTMTFTEESAKTAVSKMKMSANLSNHLEGFPGITDTSKHASAYAVNNKDLPPAIWETAFKERELTREHIKHLKNLGFTGVRFPVTWEWHLDNNGKIFPGWMNRVQEIVDWCMEENLYVILNTHHDSGYITYPWLVASQESYEQYNGRYKKIWEQISERFKGYSEKLIFANANEMLGKAGDENWDAIRGWMEKWNQLFVDTVRASGGNNEKRNLIVSNLGASGHYILNALNLPKDTIPDHLIFEIHCYEPEKFCSGENGALDSSGNNFVTKYEGEAIFNPEYSFDETWEFSKENDIPVIIGEWGVQDAGGKIVPDAERVKYANDFVPAAMERGFAAFIWGPFWFFGYDDSSKMKYPNYLQTIKDCTKNTSFDTLKYTADYVPNFKDAALESKSSQKALVWDFVSGTQSTEYSGYYVEYDITSMFGGKLPQKDETIRLYFDVSTNKKTSEPVTYSVYLVDTSDAANGWCEILGTADDRINIHVDENGRNIFNVDKIIKVKNAPSEKIMLRIEYSKNEYDKDMTMNVYSNFAP